jgi:hypothetical protein
MRNVLTALVCFAVVAVGVITCRPPIALGIGKQRPAAMGAKASKDTVPQRVYRQMGLPRYFARDTVCLYAPWHEAFRNNAASAWTTDGWLSGTVSRPSVKLVTSQHYLRSYAAGDVSHSCVIEPAATKENGPLSGWTDDFSTLTASQTDVAGGATAILLTEDGTAASSHYAYEAQTVAANTRIAVSVYARRGTGSRHFGVIAYVSADRAHCFVNIDTLSIEQGKQNNGVAPTDAVVTQVGDWVHLQFTCIADTGGANPTVTVSLSDDGTYAGRIYDGDSTSSMYFAHLCVTEADYPTSHIVGAAGTTRSADTLSFPWSGFGDVASEGTLFGVVKPAHKPSVLSNAAYEAALYYNSSADNRVLVATSATTNDLVGHSSTGGVGGTTNRATTLGDYSPGTVIAFAFSWKSGAERLVVNGVVESTDADNPPVDLDELIIGNDVAGSLPGASAHMLVGVMDRYITNAEAQSLTGAVFRTYVEGRSRVGP